MALSKFKKILVDDDYDDEDEVEEVKGKKKDSSVSSVSGNGKMILLEPRAFSESQQIADHLKKRNTVVVNLKRVTGDQAKRIMDFLSGTIYAIKGNIQKIGSGIFLCTPNNINVQGKITDETDNDKDAEKEEEDSINYEW